MIRLVVAAVIWVVTAAIGMAMFWSLTAGGFPAALAEGETHGR